MTDISLDNTNILIVGGAGFVGSTLAHRVLKEKIASLTIIDNLLSAEMVNVPDDNRVTFLKGSGADKAILDKAGNKFDIVFHLATYHGNQSSIADPIADHDNNTLPTLMLCEHFKDAPNLKKFVYSSAGCTVAKKSYDDNAATNEDADVSLYHDSPYQLSKIFGEFYGNYYFLRHKLPFVKARFQNVYGPREILGAGAWRGTPATVWRNVIPTFVWKALHHEALPVENGGQATRDFIFAEDIVAGLIACATRGIPGDVYNLADGVETSILELATLINEITKNPTPLALTPARAWDRSGKRHGDPTKSEETIGFKAKVELKDGLKQTIDWTIANKSLIAANIEKHRNNLPDLKKYA